MLWSSNNKAYYNGHKKREVVRIDPINQKKKKSEDIYVLIIYMQLTYLQGVFLKKTINWQESTFNSIKIFRRGF